MGRLVRTVNVNIGVDMGNALAPWIFCLALDPLIRYANKVPGVISMKAYMDDTNTACHGTEAIMRIQSMWDIMGEAGLIVAKHTCIEVKQKGIKQQGASLCRILRQIKQEAGIEQCVLPMSTLTKSKTFSPKKDYALQASFGKYILANAPVEESRQSLYCRDPQATGSYNSSMTLLTA